MFKVLFGRKNEIKKKLRKYQKKAIEDDNFYLCGSTTIKKLIESALKSGNDPSSIFEICEEWDLEKTIPYDVGCYIEKLVNNPSIRFGVHRTQISNFENEGISSSMLNSIFTEGLRNNGALIQNGYTTQSINQPYQTVSFSSNLLNNIIHLKTHYHGSDGAVLVAIPSKYVDSEGNIIPGHENDVYNIDERNIPTIKPEFLVGFLSNNKERCEYFAADDIRNVSRSR